MGFSLHVNMSLQTISRIIIALILSSTSFCAKMYGFNGRTKQKGAGISNMQAPSKHYEN